MEPYTITCKVHIHSPHKEPRRLRPGPSPKRPRVRIPRISRLMALAIHFDDMVAQGLVQDYAAIARLGQVSRARVTQIVNLSLLAPDIQEEILFLPRTHLNRDPVTVAALQPLARESDWGRQRAMWAALNGRLPPPAHGQGGCE